MNRQIQLQLDEREFNQAMQELLDQGLLEKKTDEYGREVYVATDKKVKTREKKEE